jgi:hypothetical protein
MQGSNFLEILKPYGHILKFFKGVYSIDTAPKKLNIHNFFFCNTAPSTSDGQHWFCVIKTTKDNIELFDSLGVDKSKESFYANSLKFQNTFLTFNETIFQSSDTDSCGYFCLYFIINYLFNYDLTFEDLLEEIFTTDSSENEKLVASFFKTN